MNKTVFLLLLICVGLINNIKAQQASPSNQTVIRLTIIKDNDKILMRKTQYGWMTPAVYFNERQTIAEILDSISDTYDLSISKPNLKGLFTYKYDFKPTADIRQLYVANYVGGQLRSQVGEEEIYWMPINEALDKLESTVSSLMQITKQVLDYPDTLWGGAFILYKEDNGMKSRIEEDFYPLFENP